MKRSKVNPSAVQEQNLINLQKEVIKLNIIWTELAEDKWHLSETGENSLINFLKYLEPSEVYEAMVIAAEKIPEVTEERINERFKYFCGVCWNSIKGDKPTIARTTK